MSKMNGLFQAIVESNQDPKNQRRITARVPDVLGETVSNWARPATIIDYPLPPGAMVWIHFPNGDLRYPVYHVPNDPAHGRIVPGQGALSVNGPGAAGVTLDGDVHAKRSDGGYVRMLATEFVEVSSRELKRDIERADIPALQIIDEAPAYYYRYQIDGESGPIQIGPMREDLPKVVHRGPYHVSHGSLIGILWEAVNQLSKIVDEQAREIETLKSKAFDNTLKGGLIM